ncbi:MAG: DUF1549 domain-containing protein, partial [Planctomycetaceae bacterium]|nr:DUF1549 domain-containing protein [Planctomycetaceae bacterium]
MKRLLTALICIASGAEVNAAGPDGAVEYVKHIKPLLQERCLACHGALKSESGLRLDTGVAIRDGGNSGPAVDTAEPSQSMLIQRVTEDDASVRMPPEGEPLTAEQIRQLTAWIAAGADSPDDEQPEADPREHWAFRPPMKSVLPRIPSAPGQSDDDRHLHPVDAFVVSRLNARGLQPLPPASKEVQLRRVCLDLIGLPPTRDELRNFLADESPDAWETVVDRLLHDSRHGERWARHWMDVWRYSDWYGRRHVPDVWNSAPQIWRWRDWIVRSLNDDHGYDRMLQEMLSADEICPEDPSAAAATGYLIRNWYALNPNDWMRNTVEHTAKAFLGLTYNCAHCHDHKYDPIRQEDYFRLRAFFEPMGVRQDRVAGQTDPGPFQEYEYSSLRKIQRLGMVRVFDKSPDAVTWFYTGGDERNRVTDRGSVAPGVPEFLTGGTPDIQTVHLPARAWYPGLHPEIQQTVLHDAQAAVAESRMALDAVSNADTPPASAARDLLVAAETAWAEAAGEAAAAGQSGALSGAQSLLLDAGTGRRTLYNRLSQLKELPDGSVISFDIRILQDRHTNFQLALDVDKGLTAAYVGFDAGTIRSYRPGSFTEFAVGRYDVTTGQNLFRVTLTIRRDDDACLLSIRALSHNSLSHNSFSGEQFLTEQTPVALNGWNPIGDNTKGIYLDCRSGSSAVFDDFIITAPANAAVREIAVREIAVREIAVREIAAEGAAAVGVAADSELDEPGSAEIPLNPGSQRVLLKCDFEPPTYIDGKDVVGIDGWTHSAYTAAPGMSEVSSVAGNEQLLMLRNRLLAARRAVEAETLPLRSAQKRLEADRAELAAVKARIAADNARFGGTHADARTPRPPADIAALTETAGKCEQHAVRLTAEANVLTAELTLVREESRPTEDADRTKAVSAAKQKLSEAQTVAGEVQAEVATSESDAGYTPFSPSYPRTSTGRRRALAEWITSRTHPLTARVAVNHIWMRHF